MTPRRPTALAPAGTAIKTAGLALALLAFLAAAGCVQSSQEPLDYDAVAVSQGGGRATIDGWSITLSRADVALGPFYFCAASSGSSTLCAASVAEITRVSVVDALASTPSPIGRVRGYSGQIQSASYDFGITWFDTQTAAAAAPGLPGGHSMRLEGVARKGSTIIPLTADVDVVPQYQGQAAIATAPASALVESSAARLEVVLDPAAWLRQLDFDAIAEAVAATGRVPFAIEPGMPEHGAVLVGIKNLAPPEFRWTQQ